METVIEAIEQWLKDALVTGIMAHLNNIFDSVNTQVGEIANTVGQTPASFMPSVYQLIKNLSENVIMPIAGIILTFVACYELIELIVGHNNLANFETWIFFKWIIKTFVAVTIITNTFNITMAVFDVAQWVVNQSGGIIAGSTAVSAADMAAMQSHLESLDWSELTTIFLQTFVLQFLVQLMAVVIFVIVNGRMVEIYLWVSLAPIPFAHAASSREQHVGMNYFRGLWALGLQGFLIMVCVGIYAVMIQGVVFTTDIVGSLWKVFGYTVLLCFTLFKTGSIAKAILHSH